MSKNKNMNNGARNYGMNNANGNVKYVNSRDARMATLEAAGVNTASFFNIHLPKGLKPGTTIQVTINENGEPVIPNFDSNDNSQIPKDPLNKPKSGSEETDKVINQIYKDGYVRNTKLHRRWITAQYMRMLNYKGMNDDGYYEALKNCYGYNYQIEMLVEEMRVISKLFKDKESFEERTKFFNGGVVCEFLDDYRKKLQNWIDSLDKNRAYRFVIGRNYKYTCTFAHGNVIAKTLSSIDYTIHEIKHSVSYNELNYYLLKFYQQYYIELPNDTPKSAAWTNAFMAAGAYYSLKNLIMFHGVKLFNGGTYKGKPCELYINCPVRANQFLTTDESMAIIKGSLGTYKGYNYHAMLVKAIQDNNFDFKRSCEASKNLK